MENSVGLGPVMTEEDVASNAPQQLVMLASLVRGRDALDTTLSRSKQHNRVVMRVVLNEVRTDDDKPAGKIIGYPQDGVMVAFDRENAEKALHCCALTMQRLAKCRDDSSGKALESRIGLSIGGVGRADVPDDVPDDVPAHYSGEPIEIASRLVSDIARPGQIVLDGAAQREVYRFVEPLQAEVPLLNVVPVQGVELTIDGLADPIPVYQVIWDDERRDIENLRKLRRELRNLKSASQDLLLYLAQVRHSLASGNVTDGEARLFGDLVERINPASPQGISKDFEDEWRLCTEAPKIADLADRKADLQPAYDQLVSTWNASRRTLIVGGVDATNAGGDCDDAYGRFQTVVNNFFGAVTARLAETDKLL